MGRCGGKKEGDVEERRREMWRKEGGRCGGKKEGDVEERRREMWRKGWRSELKWGGLEIKEKSKKRKREERKR